MSEDQKIGVCENCQMSNVPVFRDNDRCEDCDREFIWCSICKSEQHKDDCCRHIFENQVLEWQGAGIGVDPALKDPLFRLFDLMPDGFAEDLRTAIRSGRFHTWARMPLIGGGGILELRGMPDRNGQPMVLAYGDALIELGEGDHAEEVADGYRWLVSLHDRKTKAANTATINWIDEYLIR